MNIKPTPEQAQQTTPEGFVLVPLVMTRAMEEVTEQEDWAWADLLAAANAVTEEQYEAAQAQQTTVEEPELPEAALHEGVVLTSNGKYKGTEDGYTAAQMHDHFQAGVRAGAAGSQWRTIDSAPTSEKEAYLVFVPLDDVGQGVQVQVTPFEGRLYPDGKDSCVDWNDAIMNATHWMPLPAAPKEQH